MSQATSVPKQEEEPAIARIHVRIGRFCPITSFYSGGSWRSVSNADSRIGVIADMNRKHNGDYRTVYASDPVTLIVGEDDESHDDLREKLAMFGFDTDIPGEVWIGSAVGAELEKRPALQYPAEGTMAVENRLQRFKSRFDRLCDAQD